jgi:2-methylisocitrate lyase-like PEP mutase family enzyme
MTDQRRDAAAEVFKTLHAGPQGFIMPNAWDVGSAVVLAKAGFKAIATTSAGVAFSLGKPDYRFDDARFGVTRSEMFARMREITRVIKIPVNGDLEAGYGDSPEAVAETVRLAIEAGLAGGNIEDKAPQGGLYDESLARERIAAARQAIASARSAFVLTARSDAFLTGASDAMKACIRRANLYRVAGADCLFMPGPSDVETVRVLVREVDGPVNVVMGLGTASGNAHELIAAGVRRISVGGSIARAALGFVRRAAQELRDAGTLGYAREQIAQDALNAMFVAARA